MADVQDIVELAVRDNVSAGLDAAGKAFDRYTAAIERTDAPAKKVGETATGLVGKLDIVTKRTNELGNAQEAAARRTAELSAGLKAGEISAEQYANSMTNLASRVQSAKDRLSAAQEQMGGTSSQMNAVTATSGKMAFAMRDLGLQSIDMFQGIATGQPIMTTLIQQGAQVAQVNAAMGIGMKQFGAAILGAVLSPVGLAVIALGSLAGAAYAVGSRMGEAEDQQRTFATNIAAVGRAAELSAGQLKGYVDALKAKGTSGSEATAIVSSLSRNVGLSGAQIGQISAAAPDAAAGMGVSQIDAANKLAEAARGSASAIKSLDDAFNLLTPDQRANVDVMLAHNEALKAGEIVLKAAEARFKNLNEEALSPSARAFRDMKVGWDDFVTSLAASDPVMKTVQGWGDIFGYLADKIKGVSAEQLSQQIVALNNEALAVQSKLANLPTSQQNGDEARIYQIRLTSLNEQTDALIAKSRQLAEAVPVAAYVPPASTAATTATGGSPQSVDSKALLALAESRAGASDAGKIAAYRDEITKFNTELATMGGRTAENATRFDVLTAAIAADGKSIEDINKKSVTHRTNLEKQTDTLDAQIAAQRNLTAAYGKGAGAVAEVMAKQEAEKKLITDGLTPGTEKYRTALANVTQKQLELAKATGEANVAKQTAANGLELQYLDAEISSLGMSNDARNAMLGHLRAEITLKGQNVSLEGEQGKAYLKTADDMIEKSRVLQQHQQAISELGGMVKQAFDQVGSAIVNAFVSGQGAAVNFGNVARGILAAVLQKMMELAVLNPIMNSVLGTSYGTLGSAANAANTVSGGSSGLSGSSLLSSISSASTLYDLYNSGIAGVTSVFSAGGALYPGMTAAQAAMASTALPAGISGPVATGATVGSGATALATVGMPLAGAVGGYYGGTLLNNALGGNKQNGQIGSAIGAVGGAAIGFMLGGPVGGLIGGLVGGTGGGALGGLFGPAKTDATAVGKYNLVTGEVWESNGKKETQETQSKRQAILTGMQTANTQMASLTGEAVPNANVTMQVGQRDGGRMIYTENGQTTDFRTSVAGVNDMLGEFARLITKSFAERATGDVKTIFDHSGGDYDTAIKGLTFLKGEYATLGAAAENQGTIAPQIAAYTAQIDTLNSVYGTAIATAKEYGLSETALVKSRDALTTAVKAEIEALSVAAQFKTTNEGYTSRYLSASATISQSPADAQKASLYVADTNAAAERTKLSDTLKGLYGDAFVSSTDYATEMALLEKTLGAERLAITTQYAAQIAAADAAGKSTATAAQQATINTAQTAFTTAQTALVTALNKQISATQSQVSALTTNSNALHAAIDSLHKYTASLDTSSVSPLTPEAQLAAAQAAFDKDSAAAKGGDLTAAGAVQGDAGTLLTKAQSYYGSGTAAYQAIYMQTVAALNAVEAGMASSAGVADQQLTALNAQLKVETDQLSTAQLIGSQTVAGIEKLNATMLTSFAALQAAYVAAGQKASAAGLTPAQAAASTAQQSVSVADTVSGLYQSVLGRTGEAAGTAYWTDKLSTGAMTTAEVTNAFITSTEASTNFVAQAYAQLLGRTGEAAGTSYWTDKLTSGAMTQDQVAAAFVTSPEYLKLQGYAEGGWVGNGVWNKDSVRASFAGGGDIALAGGEYVVKAPSAAKYGSLLAEINAGTFSAGNDNGGAAMLAELRALRAEVAELRKVTAAGAMHVGAKVSEGNQMTQGQTAAVKLRAQRA